jgi:hypothetical protein
LTGFDLPFQDKEEHTWGEKAILVVWMDICTMHLIGLAALVLMLLPSIVNQSMLASNTLRSVNSTAWPVLNSSLCALGASWTWCCALQFAMGLPRLALCTGMHSVARILVAYACAASSCPLPPIFMPRTVASGLALFVGGLLLYVSHMHTSFFDTEAFYMNHAWACAVVLLCMRHTAFRLSVWVAE